MIICKLPPKQGIRFAWLPVWTEDGKVWLEWVHFRYNDVGLEGSYTYRRWVPTKEYDAGKRAWGSTCPSVTGRDGADYE